MEQVYGDCVGCSINGPLEDKGKCSICGTIDK